jgi:hypothetical protein
VEAAFRWAREVGPSQPITTTIFGKPEMQQRIIELSDVLSFHNYSTLPSLKHQAASLAKHGRPLFCTEWMARTHGSRFETHLPFFKAQKIGCWNWGFVAGRTQTYFSWGTIRTPGAPEPSTWFHDILRRDGTAYRKYEVSTIRYVTGMSKTPPPAPIVLVPTAEKAPVLWRSTLEQPAANWFRLGFNDSSWKQSSAPFGQPDPKIGRQPRTKWTSSRLWVRREFEMPSGSFAELALTIHHDEDTEVYVDGVLVAKLTGYNAAYDDHLLSPEAVALLKPGKHLFAVKCLQTVGGQYLDLGIKALPPEASAPR